MSKFDNTDAKQVLVFNPQKRLVGVFHSALAAAKSLGIHTQSVHYACTGRCIAAGKLYLRHLSDDIEVTFSDLGELKLEDYDDLCGVKRKVYPNSKMERKGMKYKKQINN